MIWFLGIACAVLAGVVLWLLTKRRRAPSIDPTMLLTQQIEALRTQVTESLARVTDHVHQQLEAVGQRVQASSGDIHQRLDSAARLFADLKSQLGQLSQANLQIQEAMKDVASLQDILRPPKLRGGMGEILLEQLLGEILPAEHYQMQYRFSDGTIVDAVLRLKEGLVPVDAKFPLENFKRMLEAPSEEDRRAARREFAANVRKHINDIRDKYIQPDEGTLPFALMYIPAENVYYETILRDDETDKELYAYGISRKVIPVSPNSFYAYLQTLLLGFRGLRVEERAREILASLTRLQGDLARFAEDFGKVGMHLSSAQARYEDAQKRLERFAERLSAASGGTEEALPIKPETKVPELTSGS